MKYFIISFLFVSYFNTNLNSLHKIESIETGIISDCPSSEAFDWVGINLFMTSNRLEDHRVKLSIDPKKHNEEVISNLLLEVIGGDPQSLIDLNLYWQALGDYWQKQGVKPVSDNSICQSILMALNKDSVLKTNQHTHALRAFYRIEGHYLVIFKSKETSTARVPVRLLNEDFQVISSFGM